MSLFVFLFISVAIMATKMFCGDNEVGLKTFIESVLDSDNEYSDFSDDETESVKSSSESAECLLRAAIVMFHYTTGLCGCVYSD
jgi:hypothetical protein